MPFVGKKCQKIGHFSSKKAFCCIFFAMVLAWGGNSAFSEVAHDWLLIFLSFIK